MLVYILNTQLKGQAISFSHYNCKLNIPSFILCSKLIISTMSIFLCFLLLTSIELASSYSQNGACSTSCGLQKICCPFRLRGDDPNECGKTSYELSCEGNHTVLLNLSHSSYIVSNISYEMQSATLVDVLLENSNCSLPSISPSFSYFLPMELSSLYKWITFMNCSERIHDERYRLVPCLTRIYSSFVYFIQDFYADRIEVLQPQCSFMVTIPSQSDLGEHQDIFQFLRQGFTAHFDYSPLPSTAEILLDCLIRNMEYVVGNIKNFILFPFRFFGEDIISCISNPQIMLYRFRFAVLLCVILGSAVILFVILLICRFVFAPLCLLVFLAYNLTKSFVPIDVVERFLKNQEALSPTRYSFNEIITMTNNFKEKLGQGGFGSVFKGRLPGHHLVAVKMMTKSMGDGEDFINEVSTIGRIHHVNIVHLVGFCAEGSYRALVYEYMANGSLDKYIFTSNGENKFFSMEKLDEIALSVAKGLNYLHQGCNMRILHFDIKPHNILLDHKFTPKISDFGLAKLYPKDNSLVSISATRGTIGYIAPELVSRSFGNVSHKSDVYSFGMLLMDMAGGRRHLDMNVENSSQVYYPSWIYDKLQHFEGNDINDTFEINNLERKLCKVGLWCIQTRPADRPSMSKVIEMLEADVNSLQIPPKPFFSTSNLKPTNNFYMNSIQSELSIISNN